MDIKYVKSTILFVFSLTVSMSFGQNPASLDPSFDPGTGTFLQTQVFALALQPDGKILIGGGFSEYDGTPRNRIARVNTDGTLDMTFDPGAGADGNLYTVVVQSDGKILIGGSLQNYDGVASQGLARLNSDGSRDVTFNIGAGAGPGPVSSIVLQANNKILIGGSFLDFNGTTRNRIARLNTDGTLDFTFDALAGPNDQIRCLAIQPDGKILVGGQFNSFNGTASGYIARLDTSGLVDANFDPGTGAVGSVRDVAVQPDGKILAGGDFITFDGNTVGHIVRMNTDGSLDSTFLSGAGASDDVFSIALQPDGRILLGGNFSTYDGTAFPRVGRLEPDGTPDISFVGGNGANAFVYAVDVQPDDRILIGGTFNVYQGAPRRGIARLNGGVATGVNELGVRSFSFYPNPSSGTLNVEFNGAVTFIVVRNLLGATVLKANYSNALDISSIHSGVYLVSLTDDAGATIMSERLVKH